MSTRTPDRLQQFKAHIAFKLASCKEHIPTLTRTMRFDAPAKPQRCIKSVAPWWRRP